MNNRTLKDYWEYRGRLSYNYRGDTFYTVSPIPYYYRRRAILLDLLASVIDNNNPTTICDFGCGDGWYLKYLSDRYPEKQWSGVDLSETMIDRARRRCPGASLFVSGVGIVHGSEFDLVYSIAVFAHVMDDGKVHELFKNISTKLSANRCFVAFEQTGHQRCQAEWSWRRTSNEYVILAEDCGMQIEKHVLVSFPIHRFFEKQIAPLYYRFLSEGSNFTERRINANRSTIFRAMSSIMLTISGPPIRSDNGKQDGNTFF